MEIWFKMGPRSLSSAKSTSGHLWPHGKHCIVLNWPSICTVPHLLTYTPLRFLGLEPLDVRRRQWLELQIHNASGNVISRDVTYMHTALLLHTSESLSRFITLGKTKNSALEKSAPSVLQKQMQIIGPLLFTPLRFEESLLDVCLDIPWTLIQEFFYCIICL